MIRSFWPVRDDVTPEPPRFLVPEGAASALPLGACRRCGGDLVTLRRYDADARLLSVEIACRECRHRGEDCATTKTGGR